MERGDTLPEASGLAACFDNHRMELLRFLAARCGDGEEAKDLLQDLWMRISTLQTGPIANARAYLFRAANNLVVNRARSRNRAMARDRLWIAEEGLDRVEVEDRPDPVVPADERMMQRQEAEILRRAIASLPPGARRALCLHRLEEHDQAEVARMMGISRSGVEKHLAVAMKHLRNALSDCGCFATTVSNEGGTARSAPSLTEEKP